MKKTILNIVILIATTTLFAQKQTGEITYFFNRDANITLSDNMPEAQKKAIEESIRKQFEKTFVLKFSGYESTYTEKSELKEESNGNVNIMIIGGASGELYKSTKEKMFIKSDESLGKRFLIVDELKKPNWQLIDSTKQIDKYLCYKAKYVKEVTKNDSIIKEPVTVWYAPDIPINNGPEKYWGLPGLILEVYYGKVSVICKKIELKHTEKLTIKKPKKGKKVSEKEFKRIVEKKMKQMQEMHEGGRQKNEGNRIEIKIGG